MKKSRRTPRDTETAGGFLKSTLDPEAADFVESTADYAVTGPYTTSDWDGTNAKTITVDLQSYPTTGGAKENAGGSWRAYEAGVVKIDKTTGEPVRYPGLAHRPTPTAHHRPPPTFQPPLLSPPRNHPPL